MRKAYLLLICLALTLPALTIAAPQSPMRFTMYEPCSGNASDCGVRVLAQGVIVSDSGQTLRQFLATANARDRLPPRPTIVFDSPGGSILGAMDLGRAIREATMDTQIEASYTTESGGGAADDKTLVSSPVCASACTFAFAGGVNRKVAEGAQLGIHQFSSTSGEIPDGAAQVAMTVLANYLEGMGVHRSLLDRASLVAPQEVLWLTPYEARRHRIDNSEPELTPWKVSPTADGTPILEVVQSVSQGRVALLRFVSAGSYIGLAVTTILDRSLNREDRLAQFPVGEVPEISVCTERTCVRTQHVTKWAREDLPEAVVFQAVVALNKADFDAISKADELSISDGFGTATADISASTPLSTSGFSSGVALLLKVGK